jgi:hypothetical protein
VGTSFGGSKVILTLSTLIRGPMNNDQEWRQHLFDEIKELRKDVIEIKSEMISLKIKVAGISSFIGAVVAFIFKKLS